MKSTFSTIFYLKRQVVKNDGCLLYTSDAADE